MLRQNERLTNYENLGFNDRPSSAYGISPPESRWNREGLNNYRPRSTYNADQYDSSSLGRLAYANERLSSARVQQAEQALRDFHAKTGQLYCSPRNGYNHGAQSSYLHQDLEAPRMRAIDLMSASGSSAWNTPRSLSHGDYEYEYGLRDSSGRFRTGYSLGESLPRSTIIKAQQRARSRAYTASACSCHLQDSYVPRPRQSFDF